MFGPLTLCKLSRLLTRAGVGLQDLLALTAVLSLAGCAALSPHRTQFDDLPCIVDCNNNAWERVGEAYDLFFVEFDDQGLLYPKEPQFGSAWNQIELTLKNLHALADKRPLNLVVYVHGWKHDASAEDGNVRQFHQVLKSISILEDARSSDPTKGRKVVGIYLAWRGVATYLEPFKEASFYSRKLTAQRVAEGSARYLLARLRTLQRAENCKWTAILCQLNSPPSAVDQSRVASAAEDARVRMLIIGHSFGGLIVFNAISGSLIESLTEEGSGTREDSMGLPALQRFGDMVILLNPAFEATRYTPLHRVATRRPFSSYHAPLLVALSSTADRANRVYFPWGRRLSTMFERTASQEEVEANVNTIGYMDAYITHELTLLGDAHPTSPDCKNWKEDAHDEAQMRRNLADENKAAQTFFAPYKNETGSFVLTDGWKREFCGGIALKHRVWTDRPPGEANSPNSPIWNIAVDGAIISSHNDIESEFLVNFVRQIYQDAVHTMDSQ